MRIVITSELWYPDTYGGSERVAAETARGLAARGHEVAVWTLRNRAAELPARERSGTLTVNRRGAVRWYRIVPRTLPMIGVGLRAARDAADADLIITHHVWTSLGLELRRTRTPILHHFHASPSLEWRYSGDRASRHFGRGPLRAVRPVAFAAYGRAIAAAERRMLDQAAAVTALSEFSRAIIAREHPEALERLTLIPGGVDTAHYRPSGDREAVRRRLGFAPGEQVLLTVRRLEPRMGIGQLLGAVARLTAGYPALRLVVVGDGILRDELQVRARRLDLGDVVRFAGRLDDAALLDHYQAADLFVLPTQAYEGFGMVTLEALACGTPVVASPAGASPEILCPLEPGLVSADSGEAAIAEAIGRWLGADLAALRGRARQHAQDYAWERIVDRYEDLCREVARRR